MADESKPIRVETRMRPGFAPFLIALLALVAAATFFVLHQYAAAVPGGRIKPALAPSALPVTTPVTVTTAPRRLLAFLPAGADETVGRALLEATGHATAGPFPGRISARPTGDHRILVTVVMPVAVHRLIATGEIATGGLPGSSSLATGRLLVSTNNTVYGVTMNPRTHRAVFLFAFNRSGTKLWALNWNALGIISQSASLQ
jgi:hypothetical protein